MASGTCKNDCFFWTRSKIVVNCTPTRLPKSASATAPVANVSFQYVCIEIPLYRDWFHRSCWPRPVTSPRCAAGIEIHSHTCIQQQQSSAARASLHDHSLDKDRIRQQRWNPCFARFHRNKFTLDRNWLSGDSAAVTI